MNCLNKLKYVLIKIQWKSLSFPSLQASIFENFDPSISINAAYEKQECCVPGGGAETNISCPQPGEGGRMSHSIPHNYIRLPLEYTWWIINYPTLPQDTRNLKEAVITPGESDNDIILLYLLRWSIWSISTAHFLFRRLSASFHH